MSSSRQGWTIFGVCAYSFVGSVLSYPVVHGSAGYGRDG